MQVRAAKHSGPLTEADGAAVRRGSPVEPVHERLGRIVCGCELREAPATGGRRHHHYTAVLRDLGGNVWECEHLHAEQEEAHECARVEYARRSPPRSREADPGRRPDL